MSYLKELTKFFSLTKMSILWMSSIRNCPSVSIAEVTQCPAVKTSLLEIKVPPQRLTLLGDLSFQVSK
jgi:hypothetical protein